LNLAEGDGVYFAHHTMLWRDPTVTMERLPIKGAVGRMFAGLPLIMTQATGPGHIAFSADVPGEVVAIPLRRGQSVHVREHVFLAATKSVAYDSQFCSVCFYTQHGNDKETHYPVGNYLDDFSAADDHGLLLLHGGGNVFTRELAAGEWLLIKPTAFLFKDPSVRMGMSLDSIPGIVLSQQIPWLQLVGPGRIGVQSAYPRLEGEAQRITGTSGRATTVLEQYRVAPAPAAMAKSRPNPPRWTLPWDGSVGTIRTPPAQQPKMDYPVELEKMIGQEMVEGLLPAGAMDRIEREAAKHHLSSQDLHVLIRQVRQAQNREG